MEKSRLIPLVTFLICILAFVVGGQGITDYNEACLFGFYCDGSEDPLFKSRCVDGVCVCSGEFVQNSCLPNVTDCAIKDSSTSDSHPASVCTSISSTDICSKDFETYHCFADTNPRYEVHVLGSYQATSCCSNVPEISKVRVVRHGDVLRELVLVLTSTRPVNWYLDLENGVVVDQVILVCKTASLTTVTWSQQGSVRKISKLTNTTESQYDLYGKGGDSIKLLQYLSMEYGSVTSFTGRFQVNQWRLRIGWPASKTASIPLPRSTTAISERHGTPSSAAGHPRVTPSSPGIQPYSSVFTSVPNFIHSVPFFQVFGTMEFRHISGLDYSANGTLRVHKPPSSEYANTPSASRVSMVTSSVSMATSSVSMATSKSNVFSTIASFRRAFSSSPTSAPSYTTVAPSVVLSTTMPSGPYQALSSTPVLDALPSSAEGHPKLLVSSSIASSTQGNAKSSSVVLLRPCEVNNPCDPNALCRDTSGGTACTCKDGFQGTGLSCTDKDECTGLDPCPTFSRCKNTVGSYECICEKPGLCRNTRLVGFSKKYQGRVEVLHEGQWGTVCGNGWDMEDAQVACRDAGYPYLVGTLINIAVPDGVGNIWLSNLQCNGSETRLADCASPEFGNIDVRCTHQDDVGVSCQPLAVRLVGSDKPDEGRVEVYYEDEWGTICDKGWGFDDADVLCYELGFEDADDLLSADEVPDGKGKIWLEDTSCTGSEDYLRSCANGGVGNSTCDHSRDAGVQCSLTVPCDFELGTCSWRNVQEGDDFDWQRNRGSTPTLFTGPKTDNTLKSTFGTYVYIETSGRKPGQKATLVSSPIPSNSIGCLTFYYHMEGSDIAQLNVNLREIGTSTVKRLWNLSGTKKDKWTEATVPVISEKSFEIIFEAVSGQDQKGDIALDDIDFKSDPSCAIYPVTAVPDTNECETEPCDANATCTNTIGSYTCKCNKGYIGNGTHCADLDECATSPCHVNATCRNTDGSFSCTCNANTEGICDDAYRPCGLREIFRKSNSKIIGGKSAVKGSWPWQVAIMYSKNNKHVWCGGVLIDQESVLTAAHCFDESDSPDDYTVILGEHDLLTQESEEQRIKVDDIVIHPSYVSTQHRFDIAMLYLGTRANYTANVLPICLSEAPFPAGTNCVITGWGTRTADHEDYPQFLQEAVVPTISQKTCEDLYRAQSIAITQDMLCAGYTTGTIDACQGDSGGPLMCQRGSKWYLAGLTSFGHKCAAQGYPGVYANVVDLRFWIYSQL